MILTDIITVEQGANPTYMHDCHACTFLGTANFDKDFVDLYAHKREKTIEYLIRYSDEPSDYGCMSSDYVEDKKIPYGHYNQIAELFQKFCENNDVDNIEQPPFEEKHKVGPSFKQFVMAGKAIFTVYNDKGEHYTYRVKKSDEKGTWGVKWFVQLLTGSNNIEHYTYVGVLEPNSGTVRMTKNSKYLPNNKSVKVVNWALGKIVWPERWDKLPEGYGIIHEGRCGRCGRVLTTPESIKIGIGPECIKKMYAIK
ncbi:MAG: DUF6011 domain-containing protein [bacterium]